MSFRVYQSLPSDERLEFRLPGLLKEHLARAAAKQGQSSAEYVSRILAERVSADLAAAEEWALTLDEQVKLMKILASAPCPPSEHARTATARADALFGVISNPPSTTTRPK